MPKRQRQVSLDEHTIEAVQRFADRCEWSWSKAAGRCIERGLITDRATTHQVADLVTSAKHLLLALDTTKEPMLYNKAEAMQLVRAALEPFAAVES